MCLINLPALGACLVEHRVRQGVETVAFLSSDFLHIYELCIGNHERVSINMFLKSVYVILPFGLKNYFKYLLLVLHVSYLYAIYLNRLRLIPASNNPLLSEHYFLLNHYYYLSSSLSSSSSSLSSLPSLKHCYCGIVLAF